MHVSGSRSSKSPRAASSLARRRRRRRVLEWLFRVMYIGVVKEGRSDALVVMHRLQSLARASRVDFPRTLRSLFRIRGGSLGGGFGGSLEIGANLVQIASLRPRGIFQEGGLTAARFRLVARLRPHPRRFTSL